MLAICFALGQLPVRDLHPIKRSPPTNICTRGVAHVQYIEPHKSGTSALSPKTQADSSAVTTMDLQARTSFFELLCARAQAEEIASNSLHALRTCGEGIGKQAGQHKSRGATTPRFAGIVTYLQATDDDDRPGGVQGPTRRRDLLSPHIPTDCCASGPRVSNAAGTFRG